MRIKNQRPQVSSAGVFMRWSDAAAVVKVAPKNLPRQKPIKAIAESTERSSTCRSQTSL